MAALKKLSQRGWQVQRRLLVAMNTPQQIARTHDISGTGCSCFHQVQPWISDLHMQKYTESMFLVYLHVHNTRFNSYSLKTALSLKSWDGWPLPSLPALPQGGTQRDTWCQVPWWRLASIYMPNYKFISQTHKFMCQTYKLICQTDKMLSLRGQIWC